MLKLDSNDNDDDGDDDLIEIMKSKKKLSNIFDDDDDGDNISIEDSKSKLFYKPKLDKQKNDEDISRKSFNASSSNHSSSKLSVLIALAVNVYKFENSQYSYAGKFGLALCGNDNESFYRIIAYTAKNQPIFSATIFENFSLICQEKNYCLIQDDQRQKWSILFNDYEDVCKFCRYIAHCLFSVRFHKNENKIVSIKQPLGYHKPMNDEWCKQFDSSNIMICFYVSITMFDINCSPNYSKQQNVWLDKYKHCCKLNDDHERNLLKKICKNPRERYYIIILNSQLDGFRNIIPMKKIEKFIQQQKNKTCKLAIEIEMIGFEKTDQSDSNQKSSSPQSDDKTDEMPLAEKNIKETLKDDGGNKSEDLAAKMSRIGAMPIFPMIQHQQEQPQQQQNVSTVQCNTMNENKKSHNYTNDNLSIENLEKFLQIKFDLVEKNFDDLKNRIEKVKINNDENCNRNHNCNNNILQQTTLSLDSAILMNSIQKILTENNQLKAEIEEKKLETTRLQRKLFELIDRNNENCSTPTSSSSNNELILSLKNEIIDLKDHIYRLKEENNKLIIKSNNHNNNPAPKPRQRNQSKQQLLSLYQEIREKFFQHPNIDSFNDNELKLIEKIFDDISSIQQLPQKSSINNDDDSIISDNIVNQ